MHCATATSAPHRRTIAGTRPAQASSRSSTARTTSASTPANQCRALRPLLRAREQSIRGAARLHSSATGGSTATATATSSMSGTSPRKGGAKAPEALPTPQPGEVWYFAFGSNLNPTVLSGRRRVFPRASVPVTLPGWALAFNLRGIPYVEPGMASLVPLDPRAQYPRPSGPITSGAQAHQARLAAGLHGVAHLINAKEWEHVKLTEGVKFKGMGYQVTPVVCQTYDGRPVEALTLVAAPASAGDPTKFLPSARYMGLIREGARIHGLDPAYCDMLDAHPVFNGASSDLNVRLGQYAVAGVTMAVVLPLVPLAVASYAFGRIANWGKPPPPPPGGAPPPPPPPPPIAPADNISTSSTVKVTAISHSSSNGALAMQKAANLKAQETKPPPGGLYVMWVRQQLPSFVGPYFFYTLGKAMQLSHDYFFKWVLGDGYAGCRLTPVVLAGAQSEGLLSNGKAKTS